MIFELLERNWKRLFLPILCLFFLINLVILNLKVFEPEETTLKPVSQEKSEPTETNLEKKEEAEAQLSLCPSDCLTVISEATASCLTQVPASSSVPEPGVKEIYIPLGAGSTNSQDWVEMTGVESVVDMNNYPHVKSIVFEASMRIPTANGRVYAKLYNVTDKHDAWQSEVYAEGSDSYRAEANGIVLASGRKLYRVKMKSTMGYEAVLDSARIKILLQ